MISAGISDVAPPNGKVMGNFASGDRASGRADALRLGMN
jgi:hypothetical protein